MDLRIAEEEDVARLVGLLNDSGFSGDYQHHPTQVTKTDIQNRVLTHSLYSTPWVDFLVQKKDGSTVGWAAHYVSAPNFGWIEIGYAIEPSERKKGYGTETVRLLVDYLFLTSEIERVQAVVDARNSPSRRVLEKAGFRHEGVLRSALWDSEGRWADGDLFGILRKDWKRPSVLTRGQLGRKAA